MKIGGEGEKRKKGGRGMGKGEKGRGRGGRGERGGRREGGQQLKEGRRAALNRQGARFVWIGQQVGMRPLPGALGDQRTLPVRIMKCENFWQVENL